MRASVAILALALAGCATRAPDVNTLVFLDHYQNEVTKVHQENNYLEGEYNGEKVSGVVLNGEWEELGRRPFKRVDSAEAGQIADVGTTMLGLSKDFTEVSLFGPALPLLKYGVNKWTESLPECREIKPWISAAGWGPAVANVVTIAAGSFTIASAGAGALAGVVAYRYLPGEEGCPGWLGQPVLMEDRVSANDFAH